MRKGIGICAVWFILSIALVWFVAKFSYNVPFGDEYEMVPVLTGHAPLTWSWLWSFHNEHRVPLPRMILLSLYKISDNDFRSGMWLIALSLIICSGLMLLTAYRIRGKLNFTDIVFPLSILHWGQVENLTWSWQVGFLSSVVIAFTILSLIVTKSFQRFSGAIGIGICLVLLPLCGGNGIVLVPPLAIWFCLILIRNWGTNAYKAIAGSLILLSCLLTALIISVLYVSGFSQIPRPTFDRSLEKFAAAVLGFFSMASGSNFETGPWLFFGGLIFLAMLAASIILLRAAGRKFQDERALGLLSILIAHFFLAVAIAYSRGQIGASDGCESRYSTLMAPLVSCLYFIFELYTPSQKGLSAQIAMTALFLCMIPISGKEGFTYAQRLQMRRETFQQDLLSGHPRFFLVERFYHHPFGLMNWDKKALLQYFTFLKQAHISSFELMRDDPEYQEVLPASVGAIYDSEIGAFRFHSPTRILAISMIFYAPRPAFAQVSWGQADQPALGITQFPVPALESIWIDSVIDHIKIRSTGPMEVDGNYHLFLAK